MVECAAEVACRTSIGLIVLVIVGSAVALLIVIAGIICIVVRCTRNDEKQDDFINMNLEVQRKSVDSWTPTAAIIAT